MLRRSQLRALFSLGLLCRVGLFTAIKDSSVCYRPQQSDICPERRSRGLVCRIALPSLSPPSLFSTCSGGQGDTLSSSALCYSLFHFASAAYRPSSWPLSGYTDPLILAREGLCLSPALHLFCFSSAEVTIDWVNFKLSCVVRLKPVTLQLITSFCDWWLAPFWCMEKPGVWARLTKSLQDQWLMEASDGRLSLCMVRCADFDVCFDTLESWTELGAESRTLPTGMFVCT